MRPQIRRRQTPLVLGILLAFSAVPSVAADTGQPASHHDPNHRTQLLSWANSQNDPAEKRIALRQAVLWDFIDGAHADLDQDLQAYEGAGGTDLRLPPSHAPRHAFVSIPGPLSSFARMAALSPDVDADEVLPSLARNVSTAGYQTSGQELLSQTEYLKLLLRYMGQARELQALAGSAGKIVIPSCDSDQTGDLLRILGYRMRGSCGADISLETVNPTRAFITIDSGFPLAELERDLRANHKFELPYMSAQVPVLYDTAYWMSAAGKDKNADFIDTFVGDPLVCRLYLGLSHVDSQTANILRKQLPPEKLRLYGNILDFYGSLMQVENGAVVVPGSPKAWAALAGASPSNPGAFLQALLTTDDGWLAGYFDALSRLDDGPVKQYLTTPDRLRRFYDALRGKITSPGPARPVFRATTDLMLLTNSLRLDADGSVHVPGNLEVWQALFVKHPHQRVDARLKRAAGSWRSKDELIEALFAISRKNSEDDALRVFLALNSVDHWRAKPISPALASALIQNFNAYGAQYSLFSEDPILSEASINAFLAFCAQTEKMHDSTFKPDLTGSAQAMLQLWAILSRQNAIPVEQRDAIFSATVQAFAGVRSQADLPAAVRNSMDRVLRAAGSPAGSRQQRIVELLVGPMRTLPSGMQSPYERFMRLFDAQDLISIDALLNPSDKSYAKEIDAQLQRLRETASLHDSLSNEEKSSFNADYWSNRHIQLERKLKLDGTDAHDAQVALAGLLRDSLVGLLYCYYAPPGAEIMQTNALFVRSHDFLGPENAPGFWRETEVTGSGWPASSGGRLTGSLIGLPYALAAAEQNFLSPKRSQALIWTDLVPQIVIGVTVPRWRNVTPTQLRWVALHLERGRLLLAAAALDPNLMPAVAHSLRRVLSPAEVEDICDHLSAGSYQLALNRVPPSALYSLASDATLQQISPDLAAQQIQALAATNADDLSTAALARSFGTPKPTLSASYRPELDNLRTFPALMGYSSRILAETWESNNLYYAALGYEAGIPASDLDVYVPEWNRTAIENIFAANLEDWPALIRSLHATEDAVLHKGQDDRASLAHISEQ